VRPHGGEGAVMRTHSPRATAFRWSAFQTEIALIRPAFEASARLRYEDFVHDPPGRLRQALSDLGLERYADDLGHVSDDTITLSESHGVAGNPSRFQHGIVSVRADEAWRSKLPTRDQRLVTAMTAPWLLRLGYRVRPARTTPAQPLASPGPAADEGAQVTSWPTVDVVLPTRGRPELLREAAESVLAQDYAGEINLFVVHDQEDLLTELKELASDGRSVTVLTNTHGPGLAGARNTGLEHAGAAYIASCDDDDFWDSDKLRLQLARMVAEPDLMVLGAGIRLLMGENQVVEWPGSAPEVTRADLLRSRRKELHSSTLVIRRQVFDAVGGYDESLPSSYAEDYEFLLRAVEVGRIGVINTPLASIRKYNASWFRERAEVVAAALEYVLEIHPQITESRAGHARVLGQIAFAHALMGERTVALRLAARAFGRWPVAPHAALALVHATTGIDPRVLLNSTRKVGRGIT
jgi:hypothetical protein